MTPREAILRIFRKQPVNQLVWQPRIYYWYYGNGLPNPAPDEYVRRHGPPPPSPIEQVQSPQVPDEFRISPMIELYRRLPASPRYPQEVLGVRLFEIVYDGTVQIHQQKNGSCVTTTWSTPVGELREVTIHGYHSEYLLKSPEDFRVMVYILDHSEFVFWDDAFEIADREFGDLGVVTSFYPRSPLQRLIIEWMGFENVVYALSDYPVQTRALLQAIAEWDDRMYDVLLRSPLQVLNFGENIDANIDPPPYFEEYLEPYYEKRVAQIHAAGKFCHIHIDGALKPLLPIIRRMSFDGIEAATPLPQGDVTLEELREGLEGKILIDGIPAVLFLPTYPLATFEEFVWKLVEMFWPNLILGISDELPPSGDIRRVKLVSEIAERWRPPGSPHPQA
ncbi:MAG: hypothetical protein ONB23_07160 [candidate division KSB1 bacterium]|nr:hypothetical protein [candidate division KSB1 bacterium]